MDVMCLFTLRFQSSSDCKTKQLNYAEVKIDIEIEIHKNKEEKSGNYSLFSSFSTKKKWIISKIKAISDLFGV